jgi:hypothetical protein
VNAQQGHRAIFWIILLYFAGAALIGVIVGLAARRPW